ncbi:MULTISPECIES: hypothetical protein [Bacillus cereus group]|uniref:hypothetical protein n=1 Tax=Bacillus cereus group TaxID=86661 RepID=UPI001AEDA263|nr:MULTISPECIES: hypothetical protein [Bacillus cereus group]EMA6341707.1 hypothetical protein [Bacillus cytotoxicus]QTR79169.1 hypothetical protein JC773_00850 [Bacillus cytotoxicus]
MLDEKYILESKDKFERSLAELKEGIEKLQQAMMAFEEELQEFEKKTFENK